MASSNGQNRVASTLKRLSMGRNALLTGFLFRMVAAYSKMKETHWQILFGQLSIVAEIRPTQQAAKMNDVLSRIEQE